MSLPRTFTHALGLAAVSLGLLLIACPAFSVEIEFESGTYFPHDPTEPDPDKHASYMGLIKFLQSAINDPGEPDIMAMTIIGMSDDGRPLYDPQPIMAVRLSDNAGIDEDEPAILLIGNIHGNEPLGVRVVLELIEVLTENYGLDPEITQIVDTFEIWIVPVLNPYGYERSRRKNGPACGGVDLNRNFDFFWTLRGDPGLCEDQYYGPSAASEPETQAIKEFVLEQRPFFGVTFHEGLGTNGLIFRPWNPNIYRTSNSDCVAFANPHACCTGLNSGTCTNDDIPEPPDSERILQVAEVLATAISKYRLDGSLPTHDVSGPASSITKHYALTGMLDYMIEMSVTKWSYFEGYPFFYDVPIDDYTSTQQAALDEASELVLGYVGGLTEMLRYFLSDDFPVNSFTGPGITGHVRDCVSGEPVAARVSIIELDDMNGDMIIDDLDRDLDGDGTIELGNDVNGDDRIDLMFGDSDFQSTDSEHGSYFRLTPDGLAPHTWSVDVDSGFHIPVTAQVTVDDDDPATAPITVFDVELDDGVDSDSDGLTDCVELSLGTDPSNADSDGDGLSDGEERDSGTDPMDADSDDDGLDDGDEVSRGTDPMDADSDDDGLDDGDEVSRGTDPMDTDSDDDGLDDGDEVNTYGTDPLVTDTDSDGLSDGDEVLVYGTDPLNADTDGDGLSDGDEVNVYGTDPLDADSDDDGIPDGLDTDSITAVLVGLPLGVFANSADPEGQRIAMLRRLDAVEVAVADGDYRRAVRLLNNLRRTVDGCPAVATPDETSDRTDWIIDCDAQRTIRELIDILITNLGG